MRIRTQKDGTLLIHIEDGDDYNLTDDNGLDFWPSEEQVERIVKMHKKREGQHPGGERHE